MGGEGQRTDYRNWNIPGARPELLASFLRGGLGTLYMSLFLLLVASGVIREESSRPSQ